MRDRYRTWTVLWGGRSREFETRQEAEAFRPLHAGGHSAPRIVRWTREGCATPEGRARFDLLNPTDPYQGGDQ